MEDIVRGVLAGITIVGFTAVMTGVNRLALQTLWHFNRLAAETSWEMFHGFECHQMERERRRRQQLESES